MADSTDEGDGGRLSPDEAFAVLGDETRVHILRTLGEATGPLSFSTLRERVGMRDSGQFNYHLDRVTGHFVHRTDDGYELRQAGRRVVEAVLSGAITDDPVVEPTEIDVTCQFCGAPISVSFRQERVEMYCTECAGQYGATGRGRPALDDDRGYLGGYYLPPAGVEGRTPGETLETAATLSLLELFAVAEDVCPRCAAGVDHAIDVCEDHDRSDGLCDSCHARHAVLITSTCTNCPYRATGMFGNYLCNSLDLRAFMADHGVDPFTEGAEWGWDYEEAVRSTEPFEAEFTYTVDGDAITLTVNDELDVVAVSRDG